ncbi:hypothetical protein D3C72_2061380 [compost metagenome]
MASNQAFQWLTPAQRATTAITGTDKGSTIELKIFISPAPSIRAESMISSGMDWKKFRIMIMLKAVTAPGSSSAHMLLSSPRSLTSK